MDDDLNLWASDNEACEEREGGQRIVTTRGDESRGVKCGAVAWDTQAKIAQLKTQRRRGIRQPATVANKQGHRRPDGGITAAGGQICAGAGARGCGESDTAQPRRRGATQPEGTVKTKLTVTTSANARTSRAGRHRGTAGTTRGTASPSPEPPATSSFNAEIRGLFERASKAQWHTRSQFGGNAARIRLPNSDEMHSSSTSTAKAEEEEHTLKTQAQQLEEEMRCLREQHFSLALRSEEMRLRKAASKTFVKFELELEEELATMIQSLQEEKNEKTQAAAAFQSDIELRIQELQAVLSQLGNKVDGLTAFYSATVEEVQREFSEALLRQRQDLETGIQMRVAEHYNTLHQQNNRPEAGFSDIVI